MRPEDKQQYLDMCPRVFVRALRDPNGNEEYELSEGEATDLLRRREDAAIAAHFNPDSEAGKALVEVAVVSALSAYHGERYARDYEYIDANLREPMRQALRAALTAIATALKETALPTPGVQTK